MEWLRKWSSLHTWTLVLGAVGYACMLAFNVGGYAGDSDSSGYMNSARLLSKGETSVVQRSIPGLPPDTASPFTYVPLGFRPVRLPGMSPTYPTGLPLLLAGGSLLAGWDTGPALVLEIQSLLGVALVYTLGRQSGLERGWALLGAAMLGFGPLYLFSSFQIMSDMPALVWTTMAILLAWSARSHEGILRPLGAGVVFAMSVLVRPSDFLAIVPLAIALGFSWRKWIAFGAGGVPGTVFLALFDKAAYGSALASGYQGVADLIRGAYAGPTLIHYAHWFPVLLTPVAVLALGLPWLASPDRRSKAVLVAWFISFTGFYAFYRFTSETWWYMRFVLPVFPPLIVASLLVLQRLFLRLPTRSVRRASAATVAALAFVWCGWWSNHLHVFGTENGVAVFPQSAHWARENLPQNAVVLTMQTSGSLLFYTNFTLVRWDVIEPPDVTVIEKALLAQGRPLYAILFPFEVDDALKKRFPGQWVKVGAVRHVSVWRRDSKEPVQP